MRKRAGIAAVVSLATIVVAAACTHSVADQPTPRAPSPSPKPSESKKSGLCQPFPDRLIDDFLAAYNSRNLEALQDLVVAAPVTDIVASAYAGDRSFDDVADWARVGWEAGDRMHSEGYGAFFPTKSGFQMFVTRASDRMRADGIERVATTLNADTNGCTISSLASAGPVQAKGDPCAFYEAFRDVPDVASAEPRACRDGSADHARTGHVAVMADGRALIWGGDRGGNFTFGDTVMDGLSFEAGSGRATRIAPPELPNFRPEVGAWTGAELIVIGSKIRGYAVVGAAYAPATGAWRRIDWPFERAGGFEGAWTGRELLLWGGPYNSEHPRRRGLAYNPTTDEWRKTSPAPRSGRWSHSVVWTGVELIVLGGGNATRDLEGGFAYNPSTDTWRELDPGPLSPRQSLPLAWTGREVIVWGGSSVSRSVATGAAYDPAADSWRRLPKSPLRGRHHHSAVWTGSEVIVFGGYNYHRSFAGGAAYDPLRNSWRKLPRAPIKPRFDHSAIWTGAEMLVFGGTWAFGHIALGDGALYDPVSNRWTRVVPRPGPTD
jgi:hypothetical protein